MKRGFALLETIIVITFVCVSLLMLYATFTNMFDHSRRNILYDDSANIYKMFYLEEYLELNGLSHMINEASVVLTCNDFSFSSCSRLLDTLKIENLYLVKVGVKEEDGFSKGLIRYLNTLSNDVEYSYRLIGEFFIDGEYAYASIGVSEFA